MGKRRVRVGPNIINAPGSVSIVLDKGRLKHSQNSLMTNMFSHENVLVIFWTAPSKHETEERGAWVRPKTLLGNYGFDKVWGHFSMVTG